MRMHNSVCFLIYFTLFTCAINAQTFTPIKELENNGPNDRFGHSVSMTDKFAVVGSRFDDDKFPNSGAVYLYGKDVGGPNNWGLIKKLYQNDPEEDDNFGYSVSISDDLIIVGSPEDDDVFERTGSAYIFQKDEGGVNNWGQVAKLTASNPNPWDFHGRSVSISNNYAVVGAEWGEINDVNVGLAYVYEKDQGGLNQWGEVKMLFASDYAQWDDFGLSVSIDDEIVVVGSFEDDDDGDSSGSAYIFAKNEGGVNNWGELKKLTASDASATDKFGSAVDVSGDYIIIGAEWDDPNETNSGSAYIFNRNNGGQDNWGEVKKIVALDSRFNAQFGNSVSISDNALIVGAWMDKSQAGAAYIFKKDEGGMNNWGEVIKLEEYWFDEFFGNDVCIYNDIAIVGQPNNYDGADYSGAAYIYKEIFECDYMTLEEPGNLSPDIQFDNISAFHWIKLSGSMQANPLYYDLQFQAGEYIELNAGFESQLGLDAHYEINQCDSSVLNNTLNKQDLTKFK